MIRTAPGGDRTYRLTVDGLNYRADSNGRGGLAPMNCETVGSLEK